MRANGIDDANIRQTSLGEKYAVVEFLIFVEQPSSGHPRMRVVSHFPGIDVQRQCYGLECPKVRNLLPNRLPNRPRWGSVHSGLTLNDCGRSTCHRRGSSGGNVHDRVRQVSDHPYRGVGVDHLQPLALLQGFSIIRGGSGCGSLQSNSRNMDLQCAVARMASACSGRRSRTNTRSTSQIPASESAASEPAGATTRR